jgi:hypothetical protein
MLDAVTHKIAGRSDEVLINTIVGDYAEEESLRDAGFTNLGKCSKHTAPPWSA